MTVYLENEHLTATISEHGAELISLKAKDTDLEYIWQGDPEFWGRHAPVLFPFVGRLQNDQYTFETHTYAMGQHGFARDCDFDVLKAEPGYAALALTSNATTRKNYPFDFRLILTYELKENQLVVGYQVENPAAETLYFAIGGHPAFNLPLDAAHHFEDYTLQMNPAQTVTRIPLVGPYADIQHKEKVTFDEPLALTRELFAEDALIFETPQPAAFTLHCANSPHKVTLSYQDAPLVGIWSPYPKNAPFVCIEPWWGLADTIEATGHLPQKYAINQLAPNATFTTAYTISVF